MQTEETRALINTYYATLPTGDRKKLASLFTEDIVWYPPQSAPIGVVEGPEAVAAELGGDTPEKNIRYEDLPPDRPSYPG